MLAGASIRAYTSSMQTRQLGKTGLSIAPLVLGGNVFGWTADEKTSFAILDAFIDAGLNAIDTADIYSKWIPGHVGGESETVLGKWFRQKPSNRDKTVLITKVGSEFSPEKKGLSERWILQAVEDSLRRLQTDRIDVYLSHWPDASVPYEETLGAYEKLLKSGKVGSIGASNLNAGQLAESFKAAQSKNLPRYAVLQPEYNLYARDSFEGPLQDLVQKENIGVIVYFALASGFLTGKYRSEKDFSKSPRGGGMAKYLNPRGLSILGALDEVARETGAELSEIALAWLIAQPGVTAPIASATSVAQVKSLAKSTELKLSPAQVNALSAASRP
jgi:aryl-alcohol dehydrogenase-like predicted oxidoreductase